MSGAKSQGSVINSVINNIQVSSPIQFNKWDHTSSCQQSHIQLSTVTHPVVNSHTSGSQINSVTHVWSCRQWLWNWVQWLVSSCPVRSVLVQERVLRRLYIGKVVEFDLAKSESCGILPGKIWKLWNFTRQNLKVVEFDQAKSESCGIWPGKIWKLWNLTRQNLKVVEFDQAKSESCGIWPGKIWKLWNLTGQNLCETCHTIRFCPFHQSSNSLLLYLLYLVIQWAYSPLAGWPRNSKTIRRSVVVVHLRTAASNIFHRSAA